MSTHDTGARSTRHACPIIPADERDRLAERATHDAMDLAADIRELDPREVWGQLAVWADKDPLRLMACAWAAAAMVPLERPVSELLAWSNDLRRTA